MEQKLDALLAVNDIGDERQSEYALELRRLLGEATLDDILKRLFVRSLPKHLTNAISGSVDTSFDALVDAADKAWSLESASIASVNAVASSGENRGRVARQKVSRPASQDCKSMVLCRFHAKFGDSAKRCLPACSGWDPKGHQSRQVFHIEEAEPEEDLASEN